MVDDRLKECWLYVAFAMLAGAALAVAGAVTLGVADDALGMVIGTLAASSGAIISVMALLRSRRGGLRLRDGSVSGKTAIGGVIRLDLSATPFIVTKQGPCVRVAANIPKSRRSHRVMHLTPSSAERFIEHARAASGRVDDRRR